jgi:hypothetical protein
MGILLSFSTGKPLSEVEEAIVSETVFTSDHKNRTPFHLFGDSSNEPLLRLPPPGSMKDWRTEDDQFALGNPIV